MQRRDLDGDERVRARRLRPQSDVAGNDVLLRVGVTAGDATGAASWSTRGLRPRAVKASDGVGPLLRDRLLDDGLHGGRGRRELLTVGEVRALHLRFSDLGRQRADRAGDDRTGGRLPPAARTVLGHGDTRQALHLLPAPAAGTSHELADAPVAPVAHGGMPRTAGGGLRGGQEGDDGAPNGLGHVNPARWVDLVVAHRDLHAPGDRRVDGGGVHDARRRVRVGRLGAGCGGRGGGSGSVRRRDGADLNGGVGLGGGHGGTLRAMRRHSAQDWRPPQHCYILNVNVRTQNTIPIPEGLP